MSEPIKNRYEFVILFDVENGNPERGSGRGQYAPGGSGDRPGHCHRRVPEAEDPQLCGDGEGGRHRLPHLCQGRRASQPQRRRGLRRPGRGRKNRQGKEKGRSRPGSESPGLDVRQLLRCAHLRRGDDHLCEGRSQLRPGAGAGAAGLCPQRGTRHSSGGHHHPRGHHHRGRRGEKGH